MKNKDETFNIVEMINNFSMEKFFEKKQKGKVNSGYLLFTNSQFILGYNRGYGEGGHSEAFSKAFYMVRGIDRELTEDEYWLIDDDLSRDYIKARLVNEEYYGTYFLFNLSDLDSITPNQYALFEKFYNEYNDMIKEMSSRFQEPIVRIVLPRLVSRNESDLTYLLNYFRNIIDDEKYLPSDEIIIGETLENKKKK